MKKDKSSFQRLRSAMIGFEGEASFVAGYAALGLAGPAPAALPSRSADLGRLSTYPADSVKAWVNMEALLKDFPDRWGSAFKEALGIGDGTEPSNPKAEEDSDAPYNYNERYFDRREHEGRPGGSGLAAGGLAGGMAAAADLLTTAAENLRTLDFALGADERGFFFRAALDAVTDKLTIYAGYSKDRYYMVLGNPAKLLPAVRRDGAIRPISEDPAYAAFSKTLPKDTRGVYYLSLRRLFGLVSAFSKDKGKLPDQGLDRLYGYFSVSPDSLETGFFLGSGDIRALAALVPAGRREGPAIF